MREIKQEDYSGTGAGSQYAPWKKDQQFRHIYGHVARNSLVSDNRMWELWELLGEVKHLDGDILEVGVFKGGTGCLLAKRAEMLNMSSTVFLADTFTGVVKSGEFDPDYKDGKHAVGREFVDQLTQKMNLKNTEVLVGIFPDDHPKTIANPIIFCHIDVDVYDSANDIFDWVWERMPVGGIIVYDDYGFIMCKGICKHVNEKREMGGAVVIHNLNGHAVIVKTS